MFFAKQGHMKERMLERFKFKAALKEKLVHMVMYQGADVKDLVKKYRLPHASTLRNWIALYKKKLEKGAVSLSTMKTPKKESLKALQQKNKELEKALEKANVMIYGLNAMIDYAEKELNVPVRKKPGTKQ